MSSLRLSCSRTKLPVIMVIGACGHVGKETLIAMSKDAESANYQIRAGVRDIVEGTKRVDSFGVEAVLCDFEDLSTVKIAMQDVSKVFLILPNTLNRLEVCKAAVDAAKESGVELFLFPSIIGCDKQYKECEEYIKNSGLNYTILRTSFFQENLIALAKSILTTGKLRLSIGEDKIAPVSLSDVGESACNILFGSVEDYVNRTFNLTGDELLSGVDISNILTKVCGKEITYESASNEEMKKIFIESYEEWEAKGEVELEWLSKESNFISPDNKILLQRSASKLETILHLHKDHFVQKTVGVVAAK